MFCSFLHHFYRWCLWNQELEDVCRKYLWKLVCNYRQHTASFANFISCSTTGSCGSTTAHCGVGCQKGSSSACLTTNIPTVDGSCGSKSNGLTCAGGDFNGMCCSEFGYWSVHPPPGYQSSTNLISAAQRLHIAEADARRGSESVRKRKG
jgi:hypothetical protein